MADIERKARLVGREVRVGGETYLLVSPSSVEPIRGEAAAAAFLSRLLAGPDRQRVTSALRRVLDIKGPMTDADVLGTAARALATGRLLHVSLPPAPRVMDAPPAARDLRELSERADEILGPRTATRRPTWIEFFVLTPSGAPLPNAAVVVRTPDGQVRRGQLDGQSRWRADDITEGGTCHVELGDPLGEAGATTQPVPAGALGIVPGGASVGLPTGRSHVMVVREPVTEVVFVAEDGSPLVVEFSASIDGDAREEVCPEEGYSFEKVDRGATIELTVTRVLDEAPAA